MIMLLSPGGVNAVRAAPLHMGLRIDDAVRFIAALHDTTTDDIHCLPQPSADHYGTLSNWLEQAGGVSLGLQSVWVTKP